MYPPPTSNPPNFGVGVDGRIKFILLGMIFFLLKSSGFVCGVCGGILAVCCVVFVLWVMWRYYSLVCGELSLLFLLSLFYVGYVKWVCLIE